MPKKKKKAKNKPRNPFAILAKARKGGAMRSKKDKRKKKKSQQEIINEDY